MQVDITARHMELNAPLRQLITKRLARLDRVLNAAALSAVVIVTKEKYRHRTEIAVQTRGDHVLRGNGEANAWAPSIRDAVERIEQQAVKLKGKWDERKRKSAGSRVVPTPAAEKPPAPSRRIIRAKRYPVKPMSTEDAALRIDDAAESFVVFRNSETDAVNILFRRKDGNLGLIEPE